jgi:NNP family nitrate/nitrite transporter-like MFS transporter
MNLREFRKAGHFPTLVGSFLYFDFSFMVWVLLGPLMPAIRADIAMTPAEKGFLLAVPILTAAVLRLVLGVLTDRIGAKRAGLLGQLMTILPLLLGWVWADSYGKLIVVGLLLGVAGASFAVALPMASRWYPPAHQGLALGIAGAGNSGTAIATLFAPWLAIRLGWPAVFGLSLIPIAISLIYFTIFTKEAPNRLAPRPLSDYLRVLRERDACWFCAFYAVTFGGFVGLATFLNTLFVDQFGVVPIHAGYFATICVIAGSFLRPVGGYLADRFGGAVLLRGLYALIGLSMLGVATLSSLPLAVVLLALSMGMLGMGNGAVFQLVPQRYPKQMGVLTGLVGAAGGVGGFLLPNVLGGLKQLTGSYSYGFLIFAVVGLASSALIHAVAIGWRTAMELGTAQGEAVGAE